eukprot:COSAG01_NODE_1723_length_9381_cov_23.828611_4_plen_210_part_00
MGSHNLSAAAWGEPLVVPRPAAGDGRRQPSIPWHSCASSISTLNFEIGVVLVADGGGGGGGGGGGAAAAGVGVARDGGAGGAGALSVAWPYRYPPRPYGTAAAHPHHAHDDDNDDSKGHSPPVRPSSSSPSSSGGGGSPSARRRPVGEEDVPALRTALRRQRRELYRGAELRRRWAAELQQEWQEWLESLRPDELQSCLRADGLPGGNR